MRVVITGVTGFVGQSLVPFLRDRGFNVAGMSRQHCLVDGMMCQATDYADADRLRTQLAGSDAIIHLGGLAHQLNVEHTLESYIRANVDTTLILANAAKLSGVKRFIYISSIGVNGDRTKSRQVFSEDDIPSPSNFYAQSKLMAEEGLKNILKNSGTEFVILRPPLIYGPNAPGNFGLLLKLTSRSCILPFGSLKNKKAMIYIKNILDAILLSLRAPEAANQVFIVSDSEVLRLNEIILALMKGFNGPKVKNIRFAPFVLGLVISCLGRRAHWKKFISELDVNSEKFCKMTGWKAPFAAYDSLTKCARTYCKND